MVMKRRPFAPDLKLYVWRLLLKLGCYGMTAKLYVAKGGTFRQTVELAPLITFTLSSANTVRGGNWYCSIQQLP